MCLSTAALNLFLALLPPEIVTRTETSVTVEAEAKAVVWERTEPYLWCSEDGYDGLERP